MLALLLGCAWAGVIAWLLARAIRQYQYYQVLRPLSDAGESPLPSVAVIVPARNEAHNIARCVGGLLAQDYPSDRLQIVVIDDNSTDGTAEIVRQSAGQDPRVKLLAGEALPSGWAGKPHACWQAANAADAAQADWLCFLDADTTAFPPLLRTAVSAAQSRHLDMLSLEPVQDLLSWSERLIIPAGFFLLAFTHDIRKVNDSESSEAFANGQFILIRRQAYQDIGGHAACRNAICEDTAIARAVKGSGGKLAVLGTEGLIRTRMYTGLASLWEGISKNCTEMIGSPGATVLAAVFGLALAIFSIALPLGIGLAWWHSHSALIGVGFVFAALGSLALLGTHIGAANYFKMPLYYGVLFPIGYLLGSLVALNSVLGRMRGQVQWKGRVYAPPDGAGVG